MKRTPILRHTFVVWRIMWSVNWKFIAGRTWSSAKFFMLKNDAAFAYRDVSLQ